MGSEYTEILRGLKPEGPWVLYAIDPFANPGSKDMMKISIFKRGEEQKLIDWVDEMNLKEKRNIYFNLNPMKEAVAKKPKKEDIKALAFLHVDLDPPKDTKKEDFEKCREELLAKLKAYDPPPTAIIDSGGGYQGIWKLNKPVLVDNGTTPESLEAYSQQIEINLEGDHCRNIDRILRLSGSINIPNRRKRDAGRVEVKASIVSLTDQTYDLKQFVRAAIVNVSQDQRTQELKVDFGNLPEVDVDAMDIEDDVKQMILKGTWKKIPRRTNWSRSHMVWHVLCYLVNKEVPDEIIASIMLRDVYPISAHNRESARPEQYVRRQIFRAKEQAIHPKLKEMNDKYSVVLDGGKLCVLREDVDKELDGRRVLERISPTDFKGFHCNEMVTYKFPNPKSPGELIEKQEELGQWWFRHKYRRQYDNVVFLPDTETPREFNLWRGFAYDAKQGGSWEKFKAHMLDNICQGDKTLYEYLIKWMAYMFQRLHEPGHVAVVLRGKKGTGKSIFGEQIGKLFGQHYMQISNNDQITGRFNDHLRDCILLQGDEAFWAGDKKGESVLKNLITGTYLTTEAKYMNAQQSKNYLHLILTSNESWVVPASGQERRFLVLDVGDKQIQNEKYFKAIVDELEAGGYEAMLYELRTMDLKGFSVRDVPHTEALQEQQILSMNNMEQWYLHKLELGSMAPTHLSWSDAVSIEDLHDDFQTFCKMEGQVYRHGSPVKLGMFFKKVLPNYWPKKSRQMVTIDGEAKRIYFYQFPSLDVCRRKFHDIMGIKGEWPTITAEEEIDEDLF